MAQGQPELARLHLRLEHIVPESLPLRFVTEMTVQMSQDGCFITFYETAPPLLVGPPEEIAAKVEAMSSIAAVAVARVVVPISKVKVFMDAFQTVMTQEPPKLPVAGEEPGHDIQ